MKEKKLKPTAQEREAMRQQRAARRASNRIGTDDYEARAAPGYCMNRNLGELTRPFEGHAYSRSR
jgi:hypothetical protein